MNEICDEVPYHWDGSNELICDGIADHWDGYGESSARLFAIFKQNLYISLSSTTCTIGQIKVQRTG